jgi:protein Tex
MFQWGFSHMNDNHVFKIATELGIRGGQVAAVAGLLGEGCTIPFIARYRKEATDSLDEVAIAAIRDRSEQLADLDDRRGAILKSLEERELLTDELKQSILSAETLSTLEDVYLPYRPKRRTRATIAKDKGLEPLAQQLYEQGKINPVVAAEAFLNPEKGVDSAEDALAGARDIIAEWVNENAEIRSVIRQLYFEKGEIRSKVIAGKEEEGAKFRDYFDAAEKASASPSHRVLAVFRGEKEGALSVSLRPSEEEAVGVIERRLVKARNDVGRQVYMAIEDGYKRLLAPSMETEIRQEIKKRADEEAIKVFASNLRELLYAPPLGQKNVLALDPGFRTGSKLVCLDAQGKLVYHDTVFLTQSAKAAQDGGAKIKKLCAEYKIEAIAIGNGTASRETEAFVRSLELPKSIQILLVNESGASIYSASKVARDEFPDQDVTVRGSVSIGRRLMDPLAELVKIDPKSIGVGQYQHDVDQGALKRSLDDVVSSCVNQVGVELNTASKELLTYVSGLGPVLAKNIVQWRDTNGAFLSRKELQKVPRLGPKAFQQSAGFLRIRSSKNPLDAGAVHPESYHIVEKMAKDLGTTVPDLMADESLRKKLKLKDYVDENVGLPTLNDIMAELAKPGRDPRDQFEAFAFSEQASSIDDLKPGMRLPGIVTNITKFGAFVDIGVHQDGLVHISQMADKFIRDPAEVVKVQQKVMVTVLEVDKARKRISLSMKSGGS